MNLRFLLNSGKNPKWTYYLKAYLREFLPNVFFQMRLMRKLSNAQSRRDFDYIDDRVNYYCKVIEKSNDPRFHKIKDLKMCRQKVYYFDSIEYLRWFNPELKMSLLPGDIDYTPTIPQIVKSRPIAKDNNNGVLLNMDKVRHFIFINDKKTYAEKKDIALFRGKIGSPHTGHYKKQRWELLNKYWGHPQLNLGEIASSNGNHTEKWLVPKLTLYQQLEYKFILSIEGHDVASNLKWIMSSNSIAVMPKPTCETWFMEGRLIPNYHYIEVKPDFSDLIERINYYIAHEDEALLIIRHANEYVAQFKNKEREDIISLMTLSKYLSIIN